MAQIRPRKRRFPQPVAQDATVTVKNPKIEKIKQEKPILPGVGGQMSNTVNIQRAINEEKGIVKARRKRRLFQQ